MTRIGDSFCPESWPRLHSSLSAVWTGTALIDSEETLRGHHCLGEGMWHPPQDETTITARPAMEQRLRCDLVSRHLPMWYATPQPPPRPLPRCSKRPNYGRPSNIGLCARPSSFNDTRQDGDDPLLYIILFFITRRRVVAFVARRPLDHAAP